MLVLVVDDEPIVRMTHVALLSQMPEITVVGAASVAEARALITAAPPHLVVLDLQLPDGSGLDVVAALAAAQIPAFLIVISTDLEGYRGQLPQRDRLSVIGKPAPLRELQLLIERVQCVCATVPPAPFSVVDFVQLACMGQHSVAIDCRSANGAGEVVVRNGQLFSARDERGEGAPAFNRLILAASRPVCIRAERSTAGQRNLRDRWELLVLEALRARDERRPASWETVKAESADAGSAEDSTDPAMPSEKKESVPSLVMAQPVNPEAEQKAFSDCVEKALRAVVARNYPLAIAEFEKAHAMRPGDALLCHRLERLRLLRAQSAE